MLIVIGIVIVIVVIVGLVGLGSAAECASWGRLGSGPVDRRFGPGSRGSGLVQASPEPLSWSYI